MSCAEEITATKTKHKERCSFVTRVMAQSGQHLDFKWINFDAIATLSKSEVHINLSCQILFWRTRPLTQNYYLVVSSLLVNQYFFHWCRNTAELKKVQSTKSILGNLKSHRWRTVNMVRPCSVGGLIWHSTINQKGSPAPSPIQVCVFLLLYTWFMWFFSIF